MGETDKRLYGYEVICIISLRTTGRASFPQYYVLLNDSTDWPQTTAMSCTYIGTPQGKVTLLINTRELLA